MKHNELMQMDKRLVWHPYTQMKDFEDRDLLFIDRGEGIFLYDDRGQRYYDTISSWWCIVHGHNHPLIKRRIVSQLERLDQVHFAGTTHEGPVRLCQRLLPYLPEGLSRFFFSDNGSTSVEVALKMSMQYWKQSGMNEKRTFVSLQRGYHGDTIGTMSLGGVPAFEGPFSDLMFDSLKVPPPYCYRCPVDSSLYEPIGGRRCSLECFSLLEDALIENAESICALVLEPLLMGAGGMICYPTKYLSKAASLCKKLDIHLILDEVATGFGRTGRMFALEHSDVSPDFLCLSKGITGGTLPLAVTVTTDEIFEAFYADYAEGKTFFHGHTFTANPICAAAALGSLDAFEQENRLETAQSVIGYLQERKMDLFELDIVGDVRGIGMVAAFELVRDKAHRMPFEPELRVGWQVYLKGLEKGLILRPLSDVIYLFLPLCTTKEQIDEILKGVRQAMEEVWLDVNGQG